ncbi:MAG: hypothetical protein K0Q43_17 [Ramlibacter sp.]|nr:hypothetical protein [Ramlibacter sp.]
MAENTLRCPKCKGATYTLGVVIEEGHNVDVEDGRVVFSGLAALPCPVRAEAKCSIPGCGHKWRVRDLSLIPTSEVRR